MIRKHIRDDVAKATVTLLRKGGRGVLVSGNLIITAAHCIYFETEGRMALDDYYIEAIKTVHGRLKVAPVAIEPVSDVAVLGSLDNQEFTEEADQFEMFCENTKPVPLCLNDFELFQSFPVHIYTHRGTWVAGSAVQTRRDAKKLSIEAGQQIRRGTSGSPIINESGELVGIVSYFDVIRRGQQKCSGLAPRPHLALPVWVCRRIIGRNFEL